MAGIEDLKKGQSQIADDEYYASLQSLFEKDPITAKQMDVDDITYPFMEESGDYNYKGSYAMDNRIDLLKKVFKQRNFPMSPDSSFNEKLENKEKPIMIYQEPVSTGNELEDMDKILTIMHEARHKAFDNPKYQKFMDDRNLIEETFVRFLDKKFFPEVDQPLTASGKKFTNPEKSMKKYNKAVEEFLLEFGEKEPGFMDKIKNMFAGGGQVDKTLLGRSRYI